MSVLVFYYFQGEPGECMDTPNAFMMPAVPQLSFSTFLEHFPIKWGEMHFRFRFTDKLFGYCWLDVFAPADIVPIHDGEIMVQVLRTDTCSVGKRSSKLRLKKELVNCSVNAKFSSRVRNEISSTEPIVSTTTVSLIPQTQSVPIQAANVEVDMFQFDNTPRVPPPTRAAAVTGMDEIDTGGAVPAAAAAVSLSRGELAARREADINEKVKGALVFKLEIDENLRREAEELDIARAKHEKNLDTWASANKEKRNVRTLLSTMHTVLWTGNNWKPISLADVIEAKQVKLQHRKAMLVVHPDRCSNLSVEIKFVAKRVFEAINEAYQEFLTRESL